MVFKRFILPKSEVGGNSYNIGWMYSSLQSQKAVTAYLESKQLLPFDFARQY